MPCVESARYPARGLVQPVSAPASAITTRQPSRGILSPRIDSLLWEQTPSMVNHLLKWGHIPVADVRFRTRQTRVETKFERDFQISPLSESRISASMA